MQLRCNCDKYVQNNIFDFTIMSIGLFPQIVISFNFENENWSVDKKNSGSTKPTLVRISSGYKTTTTIRDLILFTAMNELVRLLTGFLGNNNGRSYVCLSCTHAFSFVVFRQAFLCPGK